MIEWIALVVAVVALLWAWVAMWLAFSAIALANRHSHRRRRKGDQ